MSLSNEQKVRAKERFLTKNNGRGCAVCGASSWKIETDSRLDDIEVVVVNCLSCGQMLLFGPDLYLCEPNDGDEEQAASG